MELVQYEQARRALQLCATVDEAKNILDKISALQAYVRQKDDMEMEIWLAEMKLRSRRRIGEISRELEKSKPGGAGGGSEHPSGGNLAKTEVLEKAGLSTSVANRCEKVADIPEERFEEIIEKAKEEEKPITYVDVEREALNNKPHVSQNSGENEWYTPAVFVEAARQAMGGIDLDPASSKIANQTIKAPKYYTKETDGLSQEWFGRVWMNPPYAQPLIKHFSDRLCTAIDSKEIEQAVVLVNNATETDWFHGMAKRANAICFTSKRIRFIGPNGNLGQPLQGQAVLYFGRRIKLFISEFSSFGFVVIHA